MLRELLGRTYAAVIPVMHMAVVLAGVLFLLGTFGEIWPRNLYCFLISVAVFGGWFYVVPRVVQFVADIPARRALRAASCPECGAVFGRRAARRAKHVVLVKFVGEQPVVFEGDPIPDFEAAIAEGWLIVCGACGRTLQLVRSDRGLELFRPEPLSSS